MLPTGTPAEVAAKVRADVTVLKPQGVYLFNDIHNIQCEVAPESIIALSDPACGKTFCTLTKIPPPTSGMDNVLRMAYGRSGTSVKPDSVI